MTSTTTTPFGLGTIGQIAVPVRDLDAAVGFYRDVLGMRFLFQVAGMAFFDCGGVRLLLGRSEYPEEGGGASIIYYRVDDIRAAHATLSGRGVHFEDEPHLVADLGDRELWLTFFRDPDSHVLALMSEVPKTG